MPSLFLTSFREVHGRYYGTPKEFWGFRLPPASGSPEAVARRLIHSNAPKLGLDGLVDSLRLRRVIRSLGAWHVIFSQEYRDTFIHRAYVTVHMTSKREAYLLKNRAVPRELLPKPSHAVAQIGVSKAQQIALRSIRRTGRSVRSARPELVWFPLRERLRLSHKLRFQRKDPAEDWIVYVDAKTGEVLSKYNNVALAIGRATVFQPNPVVTLGDWRTLVDSNGSPVRRVPPEAYQPVRLRDLPASGLLNGPRVSTALTPDRVRRRSLDFRCRSHEPGFEEVMVYHHLDRAVAYVESLGYRGPRVIFHTQLRANARAGREDNSWYHPGTRTLGFGVGDVDDAEDGETILHEFGHALQDAICPDFGQSVEAAAMGEGFGDYFAASFFANRKRGKLLNTVMTWDGLLFVDDDPKRPPCVRRLDGRLTYESFDHSSRADEHDNGEIWSATLWDIWKALGREVADRIVIESHFQLDGFTSFAKGARAILDADRNLFRGRHVKTLTRIFGRRGIGPVTA